jgi:CheY-like chemotaxis protein
MPGLDGTELARALRELPGPVASTRLVAVTADVDAGARAAVMEAGFDAILTKPVTLERLAGVLPAADQPATAAPSVAAQPVSVQPVSVQSVSDTPQNTALVIDITARRMLETRLAPERFAALVRTFWEELTRSMEHTAAARQAGDAIPDQDRQLHSLAGSSASLGYLTVAAAARQIRRCLANPAELPARFAALDAALAAALAADTGLLPQPLAARAAAALATTRQQRPRGDAPGWRPAPHAGHRPVVATTEQAHS